MSSTDDLSNEERVQLRRSWQLQTTILEAKRQHPKAHADGLWKVEDGQRFCKGVRLGVDQYDVPAAVQVVVTIGVQLIEVGVAELVLLSTIDRPALTDPVLMSVMQRSESLRLSS